ncbi:AlwI family type II restriction endonuclease, partial [Salmonella enterica subsp. enterica serovar Typhi]|nr:AlwI family type II restriction endonuclease [Salmonella enterica subsp. enterica serovar Typhi]
LNLLDVEGHDAAISKEEMGTIVQLVNSVETVPGAVERIVKFRSQISIYDNPKQRRDFIKEYREGYSVGTPTQSADTLIDYADSNFRYLKLTGLFVENGNKLRFAEHKKTMIRQILAETYSPIPSEQYLEILWNGLSLPTDDVLRAIESIQSLLNFLEEHGESVTVPNLLQMHAADLSQLRLELEDTWLKVLEKQYARNQINEWQDIVEYLRALTQPLRGRGIIPRGEAPAYLEWVLWRAFLAINSLVNKPWEARRFRIDEEFLPLGTAPGGGPDMIFEFEHYVIVVEVTLTSSSRQEAAEGEPVRRHVAQLHDEYEARGKRVYGLFIANNIDTNTAETFRIGVWYRQDDSRMALDIVPLTLGQFADLFEAGFRSGGQLDCTTVEQVIRDCLAESRAEAPEWKRRIDQRVQNVVQRLN